MRSPLVCMFLFGTMNIVMSKGSNRFMKTVYQPYGFKMCKNLSQDLKVSFIYIKEHLTCSQANFSLEDRFSKDSVIYFRTDNGEQGKDVENTCTSSVVTTDQPCKNGLYNASKHGILTIVKKILSDKLDDINCRGRKGRTPVMAAARVGDLAMFDFLVSQGCDLSAVDMENTTILHFSCVSGNIAIVRQLVDCKIYDIESKQYQGLTPVMYAAAGGRRRVFDYLANNGCNLSQVDNDNENILHIACMYGEARMVKYILEQKVNGVGIESKNTMGRTPILISAEYGHLQVMDFLVNMGCNLSATDNEENNILHFASSSGKVDAVKYILEQNINGVSVESKTASERTPVMIAASHGHLKVLRFLANMGCNLTTVDDRNYNILHFACRGHHEDVVQYILNKNIPGIEIDGKC